jgi:metallo-beta-lactamase family protein
MLITFLGATKEVTGSCYLTETGDAKYLVDCGMFQGSEFNEWKNFENFKFDVKKIDAVLVTHAHIDHIGRIPKLVKDGYGGKIYMTKGTKEICEFIWQDAFNVMEYNNKKFQAPILFYPADIETVLKQCVGVDYHEIVRLKGSDMIVFKDAGHIFGSAFIELDAEGKKICFSGDIGNANVPILKETEELGDADVLLCESTYGDRIHETQEQRKDIVLNLIKDGCRRGGVVMIPAFSLERTQELLYELDEMSETDKTLPNVRIYLDSPLAIDIMHVYKQHPEYYDEAASRKYMKGNDFLDFPQLLVTRTKEESKIINNSKNPKIIIAGAGMMNGGRIIHHLFRYLSDPRSTLIIVGYQAEGTLGRKLFDRAEKVHIFGNEVQVKCDIKAVGALSAHADSKKLMAWIKNARKKPAKIYCVHGEEVASSALARHIKQEIKIDAYVPELNQTVEF